ncbi:MAG: diguanylate cyclase [Sedimenticola sp.]|uniref:diguanylate cyclase n=1 Tax=Sedimenticola thiotaurini TaxID=1543721 RepID=A0A558D1M8_9GAMM|nr:diguanylate cyclase [Sedimenticola sp.]MCW8950591.1 diguanylate cyclase [Sedimenticola sp.]MCW8975324.1 diguanylate cyclase [Sedimenticola sp.]TVT54924.1 MAG: diguanylate cyclase [Sedimenticola thiotaurini]
MIQLDIRTLSLLAVLVALLMAGAMLLLWRLNPEERSVRYWAVGNWAIAVGFLCIGLRGFLPIFISVVVANSLIVAGYGLFLAGVWEFLGKSIRWWVIKTAVALVFLSFLYFTYQSPDISARIVIVSLVIAILSGLSANALIREVSQRMQKIQTLTASVFMLHALYLSLRSIATLTGTPVYDLFSPNLVQALAFLDVIVVAICLTFGFTSMINRRLQFHLDHLASYDILTGVFNRRAFEQAAVREIARCSRQKKQISILLLDIDHFKRINDRYGHPVGDKVLKATAGTIADVLRTEDILGRIGGEEFCMLLPEADQEAAIDVSERVRLAVCENAMEYADETIKITVSIGVATIRSDEMDWTQMFQIADEALYRAKEGGRNLIAT